MMRSVVKKDPRREAFDYRFHAITLARQIGEYCSYCEIPVRGALPVEHIIAKADQSQFQNAWGNLLVACNPCNSNKGTKINQASAALRWIWPVMLPAPAQGDPVIWPDNQFSYDCFAYSLGGNQCEVSSRPGIDAGLATRANSTIGDLKLNEDRRIECRTAARTAAITMARWLAFNGNDHNTPACLKEEIVATAKAMGFWSVWMTVFSRQMEGMGVSDLRRQEVLRELFVQTFPGTYPDTAFPSTAGWP